MTEYRCDGLVGYGLSEYLDQIVDGRPTGTDFPARENERGAIDPTADDNSDHG